MKISFAFPDGLATVIKELIIKMDKEKIDSVEIPDSKGQILMKSTSPEAGLRLRDDSITMFSFSVLMEDETSVDFYICSC